ncbi:putative polysaccharide translocase [Campylobacter iguaniorum]|uniref:lipopolysaccharide biosynthesis protein n=1 Tax=Campylobacter iguaniorum TaxID=1244531 RepID=UPI0007C8AA91|nr:oligosaccharide flippase family protein [Campylobacter iguaniorum]ANE35134.1 putative polysaccharide translocase [Campylobacter iguaniorum]
MFDKLKPKSEFNKNILTLLSGTIISQAIPIAISPILTRIYAPDDFGIFALFLAISSIFGTIVTLRYEMAIMLPKKDEDAINILAMGFIATCFMSLVFLILVIIFGDWFVARLENKEIGLWLYFIPITVFFLGIFNLLSYFNIRKKNYVNLKNATILKSIIFSVVQLCVGIIKPGACGLILGDITSKMCANLQLLKNIIQDKALMSKISKIKIMALAKKYKDFPTHNTISSLFNAFSGQLVFIMIPKIFGFIISGYFFLPNKMIDFSSALISNSISQVYLQNISENKNKNLQNLPLFKSTLKKLFLIALCISIVGYILSPLVFPFIFGESWAISGEIAQYLFVIFLIKFCVRPLEVTLISYMELKKLAFWQYLYFITSVSLFIISLQLKVDLKLFLILFTLHEYLLYGIYLYLIFTCVKKFDKQITKS